MIGMERTAERAPFVAHRPLRSLAGVQYLYPTLRQALWRYLAHVPPGCVAMPDYVPEGIYAPFHHAGWRIVHYHVPVHLELDPAELVRLRDSCHPSIVVLIHTFGVYLSSNVHAIRTVFGNDALLLEDFAHSVWSTSTVLSGDLCAFSFLKTLGVSAGALLWVRDRASLYPDRPSPAGPSDRRLAQLLRRSLAVESLVAGPLAVRAAQTVLLGASRAWRDYYSYLCAAFPAQLGASLDPRERSLLERVDSSLVSRRRIENARVLAELIHPSLQLPVPAGCLTAQSLIGFPVRVADPAIFRRRLVAHGVRGYALTSRWWFDTAHMPGELFATHYLLPVSHYLSRTAMEHVAAAANACR
jgi:hypothetical protein